MWRDNADCNGNWYNSKGKIKLSVVNTVCGILYAPAQYLFHNYFQVSWSSIKDSSKKLKNLENTFLSL